MGQTADSGQQTGGGDAEIEYLRSLTVERKCKTCGRVLPVDSDRRKHYCSESCRRKGKRKSNTLRRWRTRQKKLEARIHRNVYKPEIESVWEQRKRLAEERRILELTVEDLEEEMGLPELREQFGDLMEKLERRDSLITEIKGQPLPCIHPMIVRRGESPDSTECNICGADARRIVADDWRADSMLVEWIRTRPSSVSVMAGGLRTGRRAGNRTTMHCPHCPDVYASSEAYYAGVCVSALDAVEKVFAPTVEATMDDTGESWDEYASRHNLDPLSETYYERKEEWDNLAL